MSQIDYNLSPSDRVELHPATDAWMSGDRHGTVEAVNPQNGVCAVRMHASGKLLRIAPQNVYSVNGVVVA